MEGALLLVAVFVGVFVMTQRWFWMFALLFATIASFITVLACIVHFQILGAMVFLLAGFLGIWGMQGLSEN